MTTFKIKLGNNQLELKEGSDLRSLLKPDTARAVLNVLGSPFIQAAAKKLKDLDESESVSGVKFQNDTEWKRPNLPGGKFTFKVAGEWDGSLRLKKPGGRIFDYVEGLSKADDAGNVLHFNVRENEAYLSLELKFEVTGSAGAEIPIGPGGKVGGGVVAGSKVRAAYHKRCELEWTLERAVTEVFESFRLPFNGEGVLVMSDGDYLEYEFAGTIATTLSFAYGVTAIRFGEYSLQETLDVAKKNLATFKGGLKPSLGFSASLGLSFDHTGVFRIVVERTKREIENSASLWLVKGSTSRLGVSLDVQLSASAGASAGLSVDSDVLVALLGESLNAQSGDSNSKDFARNLTNTLKTRGKTEVNKYVAEVNKKLKEATALVNDRYVGLKVLYERQKLDTTVLRIRFNLGDDTQASSLSAYEAALNGDFRTAIDAVLAGNPGVSLQQGSYWEKELTTSTSIHLNLFGFASFTTITEFFKKSRVEYEGDGVFRFTYLVGERGKSLTDSKHLRMVEAYFTLNAKSIPSVDPENLILDNLEVKLHFRLIDEASKPGKRAAQQTAKALELLDGDGALSAIAAEIRQDVQSNNSAVVEMHCQFDRSAFARLSASSYSGEKPPQDQTVDAANWSTFVRAVDKVLEGDGYKTEGFPNLVAAYQHWQLTNKWANRTNDNPKKPADRRNPSNPLRWPQDGGWILIREDDRRYMNIYLNAGRQFMNLCDDLNRLADVNPSKQTSEQAFIDLCDELDDMIREDYSVWFTKPTLVALAWQTGAKATNLEVERTQEKDAKKLRIAFDLRG